MKQNGYHQAGVGAGKQAATRLLEVQGRVLEQLSIAPGKTASDISSALDADAEDVFHTLQHAAANDSSIQITPAERPADEKFYRKK